MDLGANAVWTRSLDATVKAWHADKSIQNIQDFPNILIYQIWWARNSMVFKDVFILLEVTTSLVLKMMKEFKQEPKQKKMRVLIMLALKESIHGGSLMVHDALDIYLFLTNPRIYDLETRALCSLVLFFKGFRFLFYGRLLGSQFRYMYIQ